MRNHIPCMAHGIQCDLGGCMSSLGVNGRTKSWEALKCDQQFGENESTAIRTSQRLRNEGNSTINMVSEMRPDLAKIIEKVHISWHLERLETDLLLADNACCIDSADTWSSEWVHWLSKNQSTNRSTSYYGHENTLEFDSGVAWAILLIMTIHQPVAQKSNIHWILATRCNMGWMDHHQVRYGSFKAILILDRSMLKRHTVTLHHIITIYHDMFHHMDGVMQAFAKMMTRWKEDMYFSVRFARQTLWKYDDEVTPTTGILLVSARILHSFQKLRSFMKWDKGRDINYHHKTSYTTQYQEGFRKSVENEYCAKHRQMSIIKPTNVPRSNLFPSAKASGFGHSLFDSYDLSSDDKEYWMPKSVV